MENKRDNTLLVVLNPNYRLTNDILLNLSSLIICDISILSEITQIPKDLKITVLLKHTDKLIDYTMLKDYLDDHMDFEDYLEKDRYKLNVVVFGNKNQIDEFQQNNQYDIGCKFIDIENNYIAHEDWQRHKEEIKKLEKQYLLKCSLLLQNVVCDILHEKITGKITCMLSHLYRVTSNKFLHKQIINYYKTVMDWYILMVRKSFYSNKDIFINEIDLNALLKDFLSVDIINKIHDLKKMANENLIIDVAGEVSLPESYDKFVYVINRKAVFTNKRIYVNRHLKYHDFETRNISLLDVDEGKQRNNWQTLFLKAKGQYDSINEPTKSCCRYLFVSSYGNVKNTKFDNVIFIAYNNPDLIKIIESRLCKFVYIIYKKDESDELKRNINRDICKKLKTVRNLPMLLGHRDSRYAFIEGSIRLKTNFLYILFILFVPYFIIFSYNADIVVSMWIFVLSCCISPFIMFVVEKFDMSYNYIYKVIYHIMRPSAELDFNTFILLSHFPWLKVAAYCIIFVILFTLLFYFCYNPLLKFLKSLGYTQKLNNNVVDKSVNESSDIIDTDSKSIIDANNLIQSNEFASDKVE